MKKDILNALRIALIAILVAGFVFGIITGVDWILKALPNWGVSLLLTVSGILLLIVLILTARALKKDSDDFRNLHHLQ